MSYEFLPHTADVRLRVVGATLEEIFRDSLRGMYAVLRSKLVTANQRPVIRRIQISASSPEALLVDFLNEALSLGDIHKEVYDDVLFAQLSDTKLNAQIIGKERESTELQVKAVTYHEMRFKKSEKGEFQVNIVLDI